MYVEALSLGRLTTSADQKEADAAGLINAPLGRVFYLFWAHKIKQQFSLVRI